MICFKGPLVAVWRERLNYLCSMILALANLWWKSRVRAGPLRSHAIHGGKLTEKQWGVVKPVLRLAR